MAKQDRMDMWAALQWVVRDQKADKAFAANDDLRSMVPGGSVTAAVMDMGAMKARIDGGGRIQGAELDADAERIWLAVLWLHREWQQGGLRDEIGCGLSVHMQRGMVRLARKDHVNPIWSAVDAARSGDMPVWYRLDDGLSRREVEDSRLFYVLVWDVLACLYSKLAASDGLGIVLEMPSIPRLPWLDRKKVFDKSA